MSPTPPRFPFAVTIAAVSLTGFALGWYVRPAVVAPEPSAASPSATSPAAAAAPAASASAGAPSFDAVIAAPAADYQQRLRLAQAAAGLDRTAVLAALEHEHALRATTGTTPIPPTEALLARFAELDPPAATLWLVQTYPVDDLDEAWLVAALGPWVSTDPKAALAWGRGLPKGPLHDKINEDLLEQLAFVDPARAVQRVAAQGVDASYTLSNIFGKLAEKDIGAACDAALRLSPDRIDSAVEGIMETWAKRRPAEAYAWAAQLPPGSLHDTAVKQLYATWQDQDPAAAGAWIVAHGGPDVKDYADDVAGAWAKRDLASARAWSESLPPAARRSAVQSVINVWGETDPRGAAQYTMTLPSRQRDSSLPNVLSHWAKDDLAAAVAWMEQSAPGSSSVQNSMRAAVCGVWADKDPRACAEYLARRSDDKGAQRQLDTTLSTWADHSPEEVWQWSQGLPDAKQRATAAAAAITALAANDPVQAASRLGQLPPDARSDAAGEVATKWAANDPAAASRWAAALPDAEARVSATSSVATAWADDDAAAAKTWIDGLPAGKARDAGINSLITAANGELAPEECIRLAQSVQAPEDRTQSLEIALNIWINEDRAAARAWLERTAIFAPAVRDMYLRRVAQPDDSDDNEQTVVTP